MLAAKTFNIPHITQSGKTTWQLATIDDVSSLGPVVLRRPLSRVMPLDVMYLLPGYKLSHANLLVNGSK
jgi:hypothetical protein